MKKYLTLVLCSLSFIAFGQKYNLGAFAGPNLSFLIVKSNYNFSLSDEYRSGIGFEAGVFGRYILADKLYFDHTLTFQYLVHGVKNGFTLTDQYGHTIKSYDIKTHNSYICLSPQISYEVFKQWSVGTGLNLNVLLSSMSKIRDFEDIDVQRNTFYRIFNIGIPFVIMYHYNDFFIRLKFDKGVVNLMKDSNSFFREKENTLSLTFGYFFL